MSLNPFIMNPWDDYRGSRLSDHHFGHRYLREVHPSYTHPDIVYNQPWRHLPGHHYGASSVNYDTEGYRVVMDIQHFTPDDVTVKHVGNHIIIEGKHKETPDEHGWVSRQFTRRYVIPEGIDADAIRSTISSDGLLTVEAPKKQKVEDGIRTIPVTTTGSPAVNAVGTGQTPAFVEPLRKE